MHCFYVLQSLAVRPRARVLPAEQTFVIGATRNFTCQAGGHPSPRFLWQRNKHIIIPSNRVIISGGEISISNLQPEDQGSYQCVASNTAGEDYSEGILTYTGAKFSVSLFQVQNFHNNPVK